MIESFYTEKGSSKVDDLSTGVILRILLAQQWYSLCDPAEEDLMVELLVMRAFSGIDIMNEPIPEKATVLPFRILSIKRYLGMGNCAR
jgi:hypothetical protein